MKLVLCTDSRYGYSFNHRRQSSDIEMRRDMVRRLGTEADRIFVNAYTERSLLKDGCFSDEEAARRKDGPSPSGRAFLETAEKAGGWAFAENVDLKGCLHCIDELLLYIWDKRYPADYTFPAELLSSFRLEEEAQLKGRSHDIIYLKHYVRKSPEAGEGGR